MLQRLTGQLPSWTRDDHPVTRYELGKTRAVPRRAQLTRVIGLALLGGLLFVAGYAVATGFFQNPPGQNLTEGLMAVLYWPLLVIQVIMQVAALALTVNVVSEQKRRQAWDNLRATSGGVGLILRARWLAVYYRLRGLLALVMIVRLLLIFGILYDLTAFQGRYIDLLVNGITPELSPLVAALLLAFLMTATLLIPLTSLGLSAALGLLFSVLIQQRTYSTLTLIVGIVLRTALAAALVFVATRFIQGQMPDVPDPAAWLLLGVFAAFGDWGLALLNLSFYSTVWTLIPYGIFLGVALLGFSILQSAAAEWILSLTIQAAERNG
ncbi:MAG: hypothetical protein HXY41_10710 [Chloroflexi bacterium]|nr:hypothetical protein [Chloroflexota bacterium]